jgi:hypothetical protein
VGACSYTLFLITHHLYAHTQAEKLEGIRQALLADAQKQGMVRFFLSEGTHTVSVYSLSLSPNRISPLVDV